MADTSRNVMASGHGLITLGRLLLGVVTNTGDGVLGDLCVESVRVDDFIESDEGVLGSAEKRFRLLKVAFIGLLVLLWLLAGDRIPSIDAPGLIFGGG